MQKNFFNYLILKTKTPTLTLVTTRRRWFDIITSCCLCPFFWSIFCSTELHSLLAVLHLFCVSFSLFPRCCPALFHSALSAHSTVSVRPTDPTRIEKHSSRKAPHSVITDANCTQTIGTDRLGAAGTNHTRL